MSLFHSKSYGVVIPNASRMLQNAKKNPDVGLANALRVMVKACYTCMFIVLQYT